MGYDETTQNENTQTFRKQLNRRTRRKRETRLPR